MRLSLFLPAAISLLITYPVHAELPLGWRVPTAKELADDIDWRKEDRKGYFKCGKNEPENIRLKNTAIDYFKEGSANSFFIWEPRTRRFVRLWMSD
jgi:hypothetical protein